jgi:hypothetical protein
LLCHARHSLSSPQNKETCARRSQPKYHESTAHGKRKEVYRLISGIILRLPAVCWFSHRNYIVLSWELSAPRESQEVARCWQSQQAGARGHRPYLHNFQASILLSITSWVVLWNLGRLLSSRAVGLNLATPDVAVNGQQKALMGVGGERLGG